MSLLCVGCGERQPDCVRVCVSLLVVHLCAWLLASICNPKHSLISCHTHTHTLSLSCLVLIVPPLVGVIPHIHKSLLNKKGKSAKQATA